MQPNRAGALLVALSLPCLSMGPAYAGERTLEFLLVTRDLEVRTLDAPNIEGESITIAKAFGVAVFKDGHVGIKDYVAAVDKHKDGGAAYGYSTYTFEDGSITARFDSVFGKHHCDYKILSGTGAYAGATGSGTCDGVHSPFKDTELLKVKLQITTP
jgi:hypothetical protein